MPAQGGLRRRRTGKLASLSEQMILQFHGLDFLIEQARRLELRRRARLLYRFRGLTTDSKFRPLEDDPVSSVGTQWRSPHVMASAFIQVFERLKDIVERKRSTGRRAPRARHRPNGV